MRANRWQRGVLIGFLLLVIFWLGSLIWNLAGKARVAVSQAEETKRQYHALEARRAALAADLAALSTARGQDSAIRTAFGVARPGEEVIVLVPPATTTPAPAPSWWQRVLHWFW